MKHIMIALIKLYKRIPGRFHDRCKYYPTCSSYSLLAYERFGFFQGTFLTIKRILRCNPFSHGGYDPVPERKIKK